MADTTNTNVPISIDIEEYRTAIKDKTVANFPHNPSEMGYKAKNIKQALYEPIVGGESDTVEEKSSEEKSSEEKYSVIDLIGKVITQANEGFGAVQSEANFNKEAIKKLNGDASTEGSVECKIKEATDKINNKLGELPNEIEAETVIGYIGEVEKKADSNASAIDTLNGNASTEDSVEYKIKRKLGELPENQTVTGYIEKADAALEEKISADIKGTAIGKPEWNSENGKLTFKYLDGKTAGETIDLPIESIVKSGKFDGETLVLTLRNDETLRIPASNLLNPTWINKIDAETANGQTPPTTEAVNNALSKKLDVYDNSEGEYTQIYAQAPGNDGNVPVYLPTSPSVAEGTVPWRTTYGNILVPTEESEMLLEGAVPKSYVDGKLQALIDSLTVGGAY